MQDDHLQNYHLNVCYAPGNMGCREEDMAGQSGLTKQVTELVIQATQRFSTRKIELDTLFDDLGLSAADMRRKRCSMRKGSETSSGS